MSIMNISWWVKAAGS